MSRERGGSQRSVTSPSDIELQFSSGQSSREGSIHQSQFSPCYDSYQPQYPSNQSVFKSYSDNAPTRGSGELTLHTHTHTHTRVHAPTHTHTGRKDRNRPERGSGRHQSSHYSSHSSSTSPSIHLMMSSDVSGGSPLTNGFATIPRCIFVCVCVCVCLLSCTQFVLLYLATRPPPHTHTHTHTHTGLGHAPVSRRAQWTNQMLRRRHCVL